MRVSSTGMSSASSLARLVASMSAGAPLVQITISRVHVVSASAIPTALRPLAITSLTRSALAPDVPTLHESGYPNFQLTLWYGLAGPKGMPQDVVNKLNQAVKAALNEPDVREKLTTGNTTPIGSTPEEARAFLASETSKWSAAVKAAAKAP